MARPCLVGLQLPEEERRVGWPETAALAHTAEQVGFDSLWVGDHLLFDAPDGTVKGPFEAWTTLAALAAVTTRVQLGPLVAATVFHAPAMLAKQAATVDAISGGRLIVGLGAGWNVREFTAFGFPYDHRVSRFEEAFTIIRGLLRDGHVDFHGTYHVAADCTLDPPPVRPGGPPLWLGSVAPRMLRIGLPHVDAWNVWWADYGNTPEGFAAVRERVDRAAAVAGRAPGEVRATAAVLIRLPGAEGRPDVDASSNPVEGSPADIARHIQAMAAAGAAHVQLVVDPITVGSVNLLGQALALL
ncbi:LLM class flavin-dependent oxidoreductase [Actinoplanes solisilvae]|uniref:LLM class flavin-dependent oxidoreductase n=1 Tax=Actinoplanes solisilvae TaxID=2486853 RepID=UPI000FD7CF90|nr:LLM class flavin-dependent oxidoreductase [Actinoplanes solisilvae]